MSYMSQSVQLPLGVQLRDDATFESFYRGRNATLVGILDLDSALDSVEPFVYLYGHSGAGCTHLLQAACHQVDGRGDRSIYLPMRELVQHSPKLLEGVERLSLVCIDDINVAAGVADWEEGLFDLYNRLRDSSTRLLVAAECPPKRLAIELPDLVSRLSWGVIFQIHALNDQEKLGALQLRAHLRGLEVTEDVAKYIIHRSQRDMGHLFKTLHRLDSASLRAKRKLTIPFVKQVMNW